MGEDFDILSYQQRKPRLYILTLDRVLSDDIYERLREDKRTRFYEIILPKQSKWGERLEEIEAMTGQTVSSRLLIMDVRKVTLPNLHQAFNKIIGYNRKDLNKLCFTVLVGDGPLTLFGAGRPPDVFVLYLAQHRVDYNPAVFFFDPFIHYEPDETETSMDGYFTLPTQLPRRLTPYFPESGVTVEYVRRFFRAMNESEAVKKQRLKIMAALYIKRISEQFPEHKEQLRELLTKDGLRLASEKLNLYPLYFEDWIHELMQKAAKPGS